MIQGIFGLIFVLLTTFSLKAQEWCSSNSDCDQFQQYNPTCQSCSQLGRSICCPSGSICQGSIPPYCLCTSNNETPCGGNACCSENQKCTNGPMGFNCVCNDGYVVCNEGCCKLCNTTKYNPKTQACCGGAQVYELATQACCANVVTDGIATMNVCDELWINTNYNPKNTCGTNENPGYCQQNNVELSNLYFILSNKTGSPIYFSHASTFTEATFSQAICPNEIYAIFNKDGTPYASGVIQNRVVKLNCYPQNTMNNRTLPEDDMVKKEILDKNFIKKKPR
ncbi:MAG: hypothetical protein K2P93_04725 [Alphaproteobacteria bacterium]|nr:hypothetical protein [Alphaproteobacteria bacterium]